MPPFSNIMTPDEEEILDKFRKSVADILEPKHDDYFLTRWLRARNFKLRDAEDMLRKNMIWRKTARADDILQIHKRKEVVTKYWPLGIMGYDKTGCPVTLFRYGNTDLKGLTYSTRRSEFKSEFVHYMEINEKLMRERNFERNDPVYGILMIMDMTNFSLQSSTCTPVFNRLKDILCWLEANYPESLRSVYVLNAPAIFQVLLALVKPFLNERTYKKIHVYGKGGWREDLLKEIDENVLPVKFGGKRIGPNNDVSGYDLVPAGGTVPKSYYIHNKLTNEENASVVEVEPGRSYTVEVKVEERQSILNWEFKTKDYNIGFGLFYVRDGKLEKILATEKQNCHTIPESGSWLCEERGQYILKFDNTFSWIRTKTLIYWVEVVSPNKE